ncbi:MAG: DegV family protein [Leptolinea sp.]|jgi:DegV family protein with EDD domain|nr:DegV family protein [Leptolinea sp.]
MTQKIALVTDSTCDIPAEWVKQYDIQVVPLTIIMKGETFTDGVDITPVEFYERLAAEKLHPTTSQPAPRLFLDAYQKAAREGAEQVLVITISSAMSGTIESARQAAVESPIPVQIWDGKSNSMGIGWQVIAAARAREAGGGLSEMLTAAEKVQKSMSYYISLDTIEYLARGGRIAEAARFLNSLLHIKPLIYVKHDSGTVGAAFPSRSRKAAIEDLYKEFFRKVDTSLPLHITVLHNNALPEARELMDRVIRDFSPKEIFISIVSPVLGVHTGPKAIALCGYAG